MTFDSARQVWIARLVGWILALGLSCGILFASTFMLGPGLSSIPNLDNEIAVRLYCPGADGTSLEEGASTQTTTSPTGTYGHTVEITCTFADGSTRVIDNGQNALASIGSMFGLGGLIGVVISAPLMLLPLLLIRKRKI